MALFAKKNNSFSSSEQERFTHLAASSQPIIHFTRWSCNDRPSSPNPVRFAEFPCGSKLHNRSSNWKRLVLNESSTNSTLQSQLEVKLENLCMNFVKTKVFAKRINGGCRLELFVAFFVSKRWPIVHTEQVNHLKCEIKTPFLGRCNSWNSETDRVRANWVRAHRVRLVWWTLLDFLEIYLLN